MRAEQSSQKTARGQNNGPRMRLGMRFGAKPQNAKTGFGVAHGVPLLVAWGFPRQDYQTIMERCFDKCQNTAPQDISVTNFHFCLIFPIIEHFLLQISICV